MTALAIDARMIASSGIGTVVANVTQRLIVRNPGWRFLIAGRLEIMRDFDWMNKSNIEFVEFTAPIYSIREQMTFPATALRACDVLWSPSYDIPLFWRGKLLVTIHDLAHLVLPEMRRSLAKQLYAKFMFAQVRRQADTIAYVSQFTAGEFHRLMGQPHGREQVIHCGVDESWFAIPRRTARRPRPYILFVGNVKPHKNLSGLMDGFALARNDIPHDLLIVGHKEGFITGDNMVIRRIDEFGGRVALTGYVSDMELKQLVAGADALVLPSFYEGFGLPPVEAMAAGCPVLVSQTASLPEVCQDAALYCTPLDASDIAAKLKQIVTDDALRQKLKIRGLARANVLNWEVATQGYEYAIKSLAA